MLQSILTCIFFCHCLCLSLWIISSLRVVLLSCFSINQYLSISCKFQVTEIQSNLNSEKWCSGSSHQTTGVERASCVNRPRSGLWLTHNQASAVHRLSLELHAFRFPCSAGTMTVGPFQVDSHAVFVREQRLFFSFYGNILENVPDGLGLGRVPSPEPVTTAKAPWLAHPGLYVCFCV